MKMMKRVAKNDDVPNGKHYQVIEFHEVYESSGWGPENDSKTSCPHYYVTENLNDFNSHIKMLEHDKTKYVAAEVNGKVIVKREISLDFPKT